MKISIRRCSFKRAVEKYYNDLKYLKIKNNGTFGGILKNAKRGHYESESIWLVRKGRKIIGWGFIGNGEFGLKNLSCFVHHEFRRMGIGSKVCQKILNETGEKIFNDERYVPKYVLKFWDKNEIEY